MSARGWRSRIGDRLRRLRLLAVADRINLWRHMLSTAEANRRFRRAHAGFALPPAPLAFEAYGHVDAGEYLASGQNHARIMVELITQGMPRPAASVLEWGCGPGRIIRHLKAMGLDAQASVTGVDVDEAAIAWCREHLDGIEFLGCEHSPPLPFDACSFDAVYHYSVWTHLSAESIEASVAEFARVLHPQGLMIGTSHGDGYADMLSPEEKHAYCQGLAVERAGFAEGRKYFLGFHPPAFLQSILAQRFESVRHISSVGAADFPQDLWIASRPRAS